MTPAVKKRLLIVGGVVGLGALAYWLYDKSQNPSLGPQPTPSPLPSPSPRTSTPLVVKQPSKAAQLELQQARDAYNGLVAHFQQNPPRNAAEIAAAQAHLADAKRRLDLAMKNAIPTASV